MEVLLVAVVAALLVYYFFFRTRNDLGQPAASESQQEQPPSPSGELAPSSTEESAPEVAETRQTRSSAPPPRRESVAPPAPKQPSRAEEASGAVDVDTLRKGLARSREGSGLFGRLKQLFGAERPVDDSLLEELEEVLLTSDVGVATTEKLLGKVKAALRERGSVQPADAWDVLRKEALALLSFEGCAAAIQLQSKPTVALFVGVNGAGKTTTIGKLAKKLTAEGHVCVLAAGDTFRAAAVQQLKIWGKRVGCEVIHGKDGADPASVLFDAVRKAQQLGADIVLADTAGRLHTKSNLMSEMEKIDRSASKAQPGAPHETFLVVDATNGQNALAQAAEFKNTLNLTGIVLTKLDGTAKGGVVLAIADTLQVPVRYVGLGEGPDDLHQFDASGFVEALLGEE